MIENIKNISIGIGIAIIFPTLVIVSENLLFKLLSMPEQPANVSINRSLSSEQDDQNYRESPAYKEYERQFEQYHTEKEARARNVMLFNFVIGIIAIIGGTILSIPSLAMGFILGGIVCVARSCLIYAVTWSQLDPLMRLVPLLITLIILVLSALRLNRSSKNEI